MKRFFKTKFAQSTIWYILAVFVFVALLILYIPSVKSDGQASYREITVTRGDTLWDMWERYGRGTRYDKWMYETKELNGFKTAEIFEGQVIKVVVE